MAGKTWKKVVTGILIGLAVFITIILFSLSFIAKYAIEKYSPKFLGRQVRVGWVYLNPITAYVHLYNLRVYEYQSDSLFLKADGVSAGFATRKVFSKTYEITSLTLDKPVITFIQDHKAFNLDDIIQRFTPKGPPDTTKPPTRFNLLNWKINDGEIHYKALSIPVNYYVKEVNLESPGLRWNVDSLNGKISLKSGPAQGDLKADICFNLKTLDYRVAAKLDKFDIGIMEQYLRDLANYGSFKANVDADIKASGNFNDQLAVVASGFIGVNDFHFGKVPGEDYAAFKRLAVNIIEVNPKNYKYLFDTIMLNKPFFKYERYDHLDNLEEMFGEGGKNYTAAKADSTKFNLIIEIAKYLNVLAKNFLDSYYKVDKVAIYNGDVKFNDFSLRDEFSVDADPLYVIVDSVDKNKERFRGRIRTGIKPYGDIGIDVSVNPNDYGSFDIDYQVQKLPVALFNPYVVSYTSFPLDRGTLEFKGDFHAVKSEISSSNHILILDPRVAKRVKKKDTKWIPVPLIMSMVRNRGDAIDFEVPIKGNLKNPKFKFWKAIEQVLANLFVKPPSTPFLVHVKNVETQVEKFLTLKWQMNQSELTEAQVKFLEKMALFLEQNRNASITVDPLHYTKKEKEQIMFFEAKKVYYERSNGKKPFTREDSILVDKMSVKDSGFIHFLDKRMGDTVLFTVQEKCKLLIGQKAVDIGFDKLLKMREITFLKPFHSNNTETRVKLDRGEDVVPFNGFSYYKINYQGELPASLLKAYEEVNEINEAPPRGKYENERKENGGVLVEEKKIK